MLFRAGLSHARRTVHAMASAIETTALRRSFKGLDAVAGIDLAVETGEIYGFLGPNGAGKSTTLKMLCTLLLPSSGTARVAGFDVATQPDDVRRTIGVALQEASLDMKQTGTEILDLQARLYGMRKAERAVRVREVAAIANIGDAVDRLVGTYSGGMKRRLDLAAALVHSPKILFLDEPTTGLDPASRAVVWEEVGRLNRDLGITVFLTTQYLEEADALADRIGIIDAGRIVAEGTPEELKRQVGSDQIVVSVDGSCENAASALRSVLHDAKVTVESDEVHVAMQEGSAALATIAITLSDRGMRVRDLNLRRPTLDDVFLALTGAKATSSPAPVATTAGVR